jgi:hypothetical protein
VKPGPDLAPSSPLWLASVIPVPPVKNRVLYSAQFVIRPLVCSEFSRCSIFLLISSLAAIICSRFVLLVFPPFSDVLDLGVSPFRFSNVCSEEVPPSIVGGAVDF